jgi:hypothetical protein
LLEQGKLRHRLISTPSRSLPMPLCSLSEMPTVFLAEGFPWSALLGCTQPSASLDDCQVSLVGFAYLSAAFFAKAFALPGFAYLPA